MGDAIWAQAPNSGIVESWLAPVEACCCYSSARAAAVAMTLALARSGRSGTDKPSVAIGVGRRARAQVAVVWESCVVSHREGGSVVGLVVCIGVVVCTARQIQEETARGTGVLE